MRHCSSRSQENRYKNLRHLHTGTRLEKDNRKDIMCTLNKTLEYVGQRRMGMKSIRIMRDAHNLKHRDDAVRIVLRFKNDF